MARNGADVLSQKNNKLDAFLKRHLDADTFESLRAKEPCIVCSEKEDKAYKFVILSDEWIYLTENPPKKVEPVVHLRDLVDVTLLPDFPDFLQGEERECAQHIVIKYLTDEGKKGRKRRKSSTGGKDKDAPVTPRSSKSLSVTARRGDASPRSISGSLSARNYSGESLKDILHTSRSANGRLDLLTVPTTSRSVTFDTTSKSLRKSSSVKSETKKKGDGSHSRTGSLKAETLRDALKGGGKPPSGKGKKKGKKGKTQTENNNDINAESKMSSELADTLLNRYASDKLEHKRSLPRPLPNPNEEWDENGEYLDKRKKEPLKLGYSNNGELKLNLAGLNDDDDDGYGERDGGARRASIDSTGSATSSTDTSLDIFDENEEDLREGELHLFILSYSSPLLMLTKYAWENYLIRGTMEEDLEYLIKKGLLTAKKSQSSERMERLFNQLRMELLDPQNPMEEIFALLGELKSASEKNFALKRLFWKNGDMFVFCVKQLQKYLPKSPNQLSADTDEAKQERADEFEFINLVLDIIATQFRETEILPSRVQHLKAGGGKTVLDLMCVLMCFPELPQRYVPLSSKAQALMKSSKSDQWKCMADVELSKLMDEFTNWVTVILFEMILIAHQANWGDGTGSFLNITWLIKVLEEINTTEKFVERLVVQAMRLISPSKLEELKPAEAILVFQQFSVLQTLVEYSPQVATFIRNNFYEEFQYYIHAPVIIKKLPRVYLTRRNTIKLISQVMSAVLQKRIRLPCD